jgi:hypothetical protein
MKVSRSQQMLEMIPLFLTLPKEVVSHASSFRTLVVVNANILQAAVSCSRRLRNFERNSQT